MREKKSDKNQSELLAAAEAILFTMGKSVELSKMAEALGLSEAQTKALIEKLKEKYEDECCGLQIVELEKSYQMCTKSSMYEYLIRIASQPKKNVLSDALLETLSIIAYKQPVTRTEEHAVNKLIEYNLVTELGRLDAPGRPLLFGTTEEFLRKFGVSSITELPEPDRDKVSEFKQQAEQEIGYIQEEEKDAT